jgi:hypothetical protein
MKISNIISRLMALIRSDILRTKKNLPLNLILVENRQHGLSTILYLRQRTSYQKFQICENLIIYHISVAS